MQRTPRRKTALVAVLTLTLTVATAAFAPTGSAGTLPEDILNAEGDGDAPSCPSYPLTDTIRCIVHDAVFNNTYVQILLKHVHHHYENASRYANETYYNVDHVEWATWNFTNAVTWASWDYTWETYWNAALLHADTTAIAEDVRDYATATAVKECLFILGSDCPLDAPRVEDGVGDDGIANPPEGTGPCDGLVHYVRCHYTTTTYEAANQTANTTGDAERALVGWKVRQESATGNYTLALDSARRVYVREVVEETREQYDSTRGFIDRECALISSSCPSVGAWPAWVDDVALDLLA